jgi:membrane associated rhomboid family serine protease
MLIVPYVKFHSKMALPIATILLCVINIIAYNIQSRTDWRYEAAVNYYISSDLAKLEFPVLSELEPRVFPRNGYDKPVLPDADNRYAYSRIVRRMLFSESFQERLRKDEVVVKTDKQYEYWQNQRSDFNQLLKGLHTLNYGFVPAEKKWHTALTSNFLHSGLLHLIGNLVFLVIIGIALEGVIGFSLTMFLFVATGMLSCVADYFARAESFVPSIGASGAVYGFMGAFAVIYGFRWIRIIFFFIFPILFKRFSIPAAILLFYWFAMELINYKYLREDSNINFIAHLGGLVAGALIALVIKPFRKERLEAMETGV